jgi:hypothetical protein
VLKLDAIHGHSWFSIRDGDQPTRSVTHGMSLLKFVTNQVLFCISGRLGMNDAADSAAICGPDLKADACFVAFKIKDQLTRLMVRRMRKVVANNRIALVGGIRLLSSDPGIVLSVQADKV